MQSYIHIGHQLKINVEISPICVKSGLYAVMRATSNFEYETNPILASSL